MTLLVAVSLVVAIAAGVRGNLPWAVFLSLAVLLAGVACAFASGFSLLPAAGIGFAIMGTFQVVFALAAVSSEVAARRAASRDMRAGDRRPWAFFRMQPNR